MANAVYLYPNPRVAVKIGTGGSGQSGLLQALAEEFIKFSSQEEGSPKFSVEWYTSDTSVSIDYLHKNVVDVGITYHAIAESTALEKGVIDRVEYVWRDHWMLVGPKANPANLPTDGRSSIYVLLTKLFSAMEDSKGSQTPIKFLSRYDSSACNITESTLWSTIGQTPWAPPVSPWYHMLKDFPFQAIRKAAELGEYTLTDRGTWCAIESTVRDELTIFAQGKDDEDDPLLNPAHLLVGTHAKNKAMANCFADWMIREDGGQRVIKEFRRNGYDLYTIAPVGVNPLGKLPTSSHEIYFFKDDRYVRIDVVMDTISYHTAKNIQDMWKSLVAAEITRVNAILPSPDEKYQAYFFCGLSGRVQHYQCGTAMALPKEHVRRFFSGTKCVCIDLVTDKVIYPVADIATRFTTLARLKFTTVDMAILKTERENEQAYFFSNDQWALVGLDCDSLDGDPDFIKDAWKALHQADFY
ncbi:hypothetical protein OEA41_007901 [Lepraria neglecta]|uniref:PBP domain-containing protein n=1 Tax=Lepraria neglecta TaxID=209136 RepID=A0AAE0DND3_9LECA|nr:hypothetical protein OEA41_007901 [Lepraria neglecta]